MKLYKKSGKNVLKISKKEWVDIGIKNNFIKNSQILSSYDELSLGCTPTDEPCASVGKDDYYELSKIEARVFAKQLLREFPNKPEGVSFKIKSNPHDFGTYYDLTIRFPENYDEAVDYAFNIENNLPERWDEISISELNEFDYFNRIKKTKA
jgi:hypothetical protein